MNGAISEEIRGVVMTKLEFLRRNEKLSQVALAEELGFWSGWYLNCLERHHPNPSTVNQKLRTALEARYGMPLEELLQTAELR